MADSPFRINIKNGLLPLNLLAVLIVLIIVFFTLGQLRIVLSFLFVILFPGYVLAVALFPKKDMVRSVERIALSLGTSIAVVPLVGLALNYTPWGITLTSILWSIAAFIFITSIVAFYRQKGLAPEERFIVNFQMIKPNLRR
ncbi:DUF1616 domain-containing protein [Chloroflexota bacterium]